MILTERSAFDAMRAFLEEWWQLTNHDEQLGILLSAMDGSLTSDGLPIDPAVWSSWLACCEKFAQQSH